MVVFIHCGIFRFSTPHLWSTGLSRVYLSPTVHRITSTLQLSFNPLFFLHCPPTPPPPPQHTQAYRLTRKKKKFSHKSNCLNIFFFLLNIGTIAPGPSHLHPHVLRLLLTFYLSSHLSTHVYPRAHTHTTLRLPFTSPRAAPE